MTPAARTVPSSFDAQVQVLLTARAVSSALTLLSVQACCMAQCTGSWFLPLDRFLTWTLTGGASAAGVHLWLQAQMAPWLPAQMVSSLTSPAASANPPARCSASSHSRRSPLHRRLRRPRSPLVQSVEPACRSAQLVNAAANTVCVPRCPVHALTCRLMHMRLHEAPPLCSVAARQVSASPPAGICGTTSDECSSTCQVEFSGPSSSCKMSATPPAPQPPSSEALGPSLAGAATPPPAQTPAINTPPSITPAAPSAKPVSPPPPSNPPSVGENDRQAAWLGYCVRLLATWMDC